MLKKDNEDLLKNITTKKEFLKEGIYNFMIVILEIESINKLKNLDGKLIIMKAEKIHIMKLLKRKY